LSKKQLKEVPKKVWVDATFDQHRPRFGQSIYGYCSLEGVRDYREGVFKDINEAEMAAAVFASESLGSEVEIRTDSKFVKTHWQRQNPIEKIGRASNPCDNYLRLIKESRGKKIK